MSKLPDEPAEDDPQVCEVVLRAPGSGKRFKRRFLRTDPLTNVYNYVRTLSEEELAFDDNEAQF